MNLIKKIPELLLRFREKEIGISSDIRKAFQMISMKDEDRTFLKFLWWEDYKQGKMVEYQHARVIFGATCSPFILAAVLEFHLNQVLPQDKFIAKKLLESLYVDNSISSESNVQDYQEFRQVSTRILSEGKMDLRMWLTNIDELDDPATIITSVLGVTWNRQEDVLYIDTAGIKSPDQLTKKTLLSTVHKVFDPLGFLCPAIIPMKIILQQAWINKLKWDDELPSEEKGKFLEWCSKLKYLKDIKIPRLATAGITDKSKWSLHLFTDASITSYACCIYLRIDSPNKAMVQLLAAKARVTPVKRMTIPRAELMGCLIGSRLLLNVKLALKLEEIRETYWCDSTTALAWIRRDDQWGTFVGGRVREIRNLTDPRNWRHVPGNRNPADLPSRGCSPLELIMSKWWEGPDWLKTAEDSWTFSEVPTDEKLVVQEKLKCVKINISSVLECSDRGFGFAKTVRVMGWMQRFIRNSRGTSKEGRSSGALTIPELKTAEQLVLRCIQEGTFNGEVKGLVVTRDWNGLLRVKTRIVHRHDIMDFKFPVVLPGRHGLVRKMIEEAHRFYMHAGLSFLIVKLREKYWIQQSRKTIKSVISDKCHRCRRFASKPVVPEEAPLPLDRISNAEVFEVVGIDLAGPLILKNQTKVWIVIYTCAVYRAVHLDLVVSCSTKAFIKSLKRFIKKVNRRPEVIYSDNGRNFVGASNLFRGLDWEKITKDEGVRPIQWRFNPPTAAWWGGWWERLIRVVKDLLKRTLGNACVTKLELSEMLEKVEEVINGRPLTYVSEDPEDLQPLTPAMFLNPACKDFPEGDLTEGRRLQLRYKYMMTLKEELKNRFRREYLSMLVCKPRKKTPMLQVGEVVFVGSDQKKRLQWQLGRILELFPGKDGVTRVARVKPTDGVLVRPVQRLYPLEMDVDEVPKVNSSWKRDKTGRLVKTTGDP